MRRVKHNVTFKKKEEPIDEPEDITADGDTPDPEPKPTPIKDITEDKQEEVSRKRRRWTSDDPEFKESQEEKPTLKPVKDLKEDEPRQKPPPKVADDPELFDPSVEGIGADDEETRGKIIESYWKELETAEEEGRVADFEKVGGANFIADLMDIPSDNVNNDLYIKHYESKADVIRNDPYSQLETDSSIGDRENERLYSNILNNKAVWSLGGHKEQYKKFIYNYSDEDILDDGRIKEHYGVQWRINEFGHKQEMTMGERLAEVGLTETIEELENTPLTPLEELGRAGVERQLPRENLPTKFFRQRHHGLSGSNVSHYEQGKPEEQQTEFILDLGAQFDALESNEDLLWGTKYHYENEKGERKVVAGGTDFDKNQYEVMKENSIRSIYGLLGRDWNEIKPFLNEEGTKNSWNLDIPMANYSHPITDIRGHILNTLLDNLTQDDLMKLTDSDDQPVKNSLYLEGRERQGGLKYEHEKLNNLIEIELEKQGINPHIEQLLDQRAINNIMDNIQTEHGVGGRDLENELGYDFEEASNRNVRFIRMPVDQFKRLHEPASFDYEDEENKPSVDYWRQRIRDGSFMTSVNLQLNVVTNELDGHQGRHRAHAAMLEGITHIPVVLTLSKRLVSNYGRQQVRYDPNNRMASLATFEGHGNADLPTTMSELEDHPDLLRRFLGNGWDRSNQEFFGQGEMDNYWHREGGDLYNDVEIIDSTSLARKQNNIEEVMFLKRIEDVQHEANRIGGIRKGYRLDNTLEPFFKDLSTHIKPYDPRDMAPDTLIESGIVIDSSNPSNDETNVFTRIDLRDLNYAINTKEDDAKWDRAYDKFNRMIYNNKDLHNSMEKAEAEVKAFNEMQRQKFNKGVYRVLYRSMPAKEYDRMQKKGQLIKPNKLGRRGRGIFPFISVSLSPQSAMNETQPFHKAGGVTVEFGAAALTEEANALLKKQKSNARIKPVEYTTYPVKMMGETPDKNVWGIETIDSKMPAATMHELELRFPLNTKLTNAVESIIVDMGSYTNLDTVFKNFGMKEEAKMYKQWWKNIGGGWGSRDTILNFLTGGEKGESKVPYSDIMPLTQTSILDKLDRKIKELGADYVDSGKERPLPVKVRYKFERYQASFDALMDNKRDGRRETEYKTSMDIALGKDATTTYTQDADKKIDHYMATTIEKITPTEHQEEDIKATFKNLEEELWTEIQRWETNNERSMGVRSIFLGGSTGKGTYLAGFSDLDIFIEFEYHVLQQEIEDFVLELGRSVLKKKITTRKSVPNPYQEKYGVQGQNDDGTKFSHKYPEAYIDSIVPKHRYDDSIAMEVQFLGVSHVTKEQIARGKNGDNEKDEKGKPTGKKITDGMRTGNDRSIMHTKVITPLIRGLEQEARLLKNNLQEIKVYDSSGKERGFSGYASELLIARLGSFKEVLKYFANFKPYSKLGDTDRNFGTMLVLPDEIDPNRNLAAAFSDEKNDHPLRKNFKLARLIKVSKFMLKHGRAPKFESTKRDTIGFTFNMPTGDENAMYQQLYSAAKQIQTAIKKQGYNLDVVTEQIAEDFEVDVPRINVKVGALGKIEKKISKVTISFGFPDDDTNNTNEHMNLPRQYWKAGIAVNQPKDRVIAWKKAQIARFDEPIDEANTSGEFPYGDNKPMFKTEKDVNGDERYYVYMSRYRTFITDWLRNEIWNKTLGLGKMNEYMTTDTETGESIGLDPQFTAKEDTGSRQPEWNHINSYENITGDPDKHEE